jgi:adenosylmethionine-8-amino-7-oxononanoate aminotransferase
MAVGDRGPFTRAFHDHLFPVEFIPWPDGTNNKSVINAFADASANDGVAAFIYEPLIQGAAGMRVYDAELLNCLIGIAKEKEIITIADEVFTGFGRTGKLFASEYLATQPDIMALSKGLTGGTMALGITTCTKKIQSAYDSSEKFHTFFHGHSFTANPIACASALASLRILRTPACQERIMLIERAQKKFANKIKDNALIERVHQIGTIVSIELKTDSRTSYFNNLRDTMYDYFLGRDILLRPLGNVLYFLPSFAFEEKDLQVVHHAIEEFLSHMAQSKRNVYGK